MSAPAMCLAGVLAAERLAAPHIVSMRHRSDVKSIRSHTSTIVAGVIYLMSVRDFADEKSVGNAMGLLRSHAIPELSVAVRIQGCGPFQQPVAVSTSYFARKRSSTVKGGLR